MNNRGLIILCVLMLGHAVHTHLNAADDSHPRFWQAVLENRLSALESEEGVKDVEELTEEDVERMSELTEKVVARLKADPSFVRFLRKEMRSADDDGSRLVACICLIKALEGQLPIEDPIYMMSDPNDAIRIFGRLYIRSQDLKESYIVLPSLLLQSDPERAEGLYLIRKEYGPKGLPYYAKLIYASNPKVAEEAALAFQTCSIEDATPHLLRFLRSDHENRNREEIVLAVLETLDALYNEESAETEGLELRVKRWIEKLSRDVKGEP